MNQSNKKNTSRWYLPIVYVLAFAALVIAILPTLLSLSACKPMIEKRLSHALQGTVTMQSMHLSWFTSQSIEDFHYKSFDGKYSFEFKSLHISSTLFKYLITPYLSRFSEPGVTRLFSPLLQIHPTTTPKACHKTSKIKKHSLPLFLLQNFSILNGTLLYQYHETATLHHVNAQLKLKEAAFISLVAQGTSLVGVTPGHFSIQCNMAHPFLPHTLDVMLDHFPLASIDAALDLPGVCSQLLGPTLSGKLSLKTVDHQTLLCMEATAAHLISSFEGQLLEHTLSLTKPASVALTLTPQSFDFWTQLTSMDSSLSITRNAALQIVIDSLSIPYTPTALHLQHLAYKAKIEASLLALNIANAAQPISVNAFSLSSASQDLARSLDLAMHTSFNYHLKTPSYLNAGMKLEHIFSKDWNNILHDFQLDAVKLPVVLLETLLDNKAPLVKLLGDSLTINISPNLPTNPLEYEIHVSSPQLQIPELHCLVNNAITLLQPATMTYTPDPARAYAHLSSPYFTLSDVGKLYGTLDSLHLPLDVGLKSLEHDLKFQLRVHADTLDVYPSDLPGVFTCKSTSLAINTAEPSHLDVRASTTLLYFDEKIADQELFRTPAKVDISTSLSLRHLSPLSLPHIVCNIYNSTDKISMVCSLQEQLLTFLQPISAELQPRADEWSLWTKIHHPSLSYVFSPLTLKMSIEPLDFKQPLFEQLSVNAEMLLPRLDLVDKVFLRDFVFSDCTAHLSLNTAQKTFDTSLNTKIKAQGKAPGTFSLTLNAKDFNFLSDLTQNLNMTASCKGIPPSLVDTLYGYKNALYILVGDTFEGSLALVNNHGLMHISSQGEGSQLTFSGDALVSAEAVHIAKPFECSFKLSTNSLAALEQIEGTLLENFALTSPALVQLTANSFYWPIHEPLFPTPFSFKGLIHNVTHQLSKSYFHLIAKADHLNILSHADEKVISLQDCIFESVKTEAKSPLVLHLSSAVTEEGSGTELGHVTSSLTLQSTKDIQGRPMLLSKLKAELGRFPTLLIDEFFQMLSLRELPPSVLLGQEINATLDMDLENLSGHIDAEIHSGDTHGNVNAYLTDGVVKLYKPIRASLKITPALANFFLKKMNVSLSLANNPLQLFISDQGFYFPLEHFDIKTLQIRQARVDLGRILCENRGNPLEVSGFFKLSQDKHGQLALWFAPMDFSVGNGLMQIDRTEVLFNDAYQIAFWGRMDLAKNYVNMVLGLTEQSLRKALGIRGLPKSFVLQIPMTGPVDNVKINTEIATARITFLLAKASGLTDQAGLWGGIVNTLGEFANDQTTVPPAKPPFPWQEQLSLYEAEEKKRLSAQILR